MAETSSDPRSLEAATMRKVGRDKTGSFPVALLPLCVLTAVGCLLVFWIGREQMRAAPPVTAAPAG